MTRTTPTTRTTRTASPQHGVTRRGFTRRGFTLWETALVLAVLMVTLALAAPALVNFGTSRAQSDAEALLVVLRDARREAVQASTLVAVRLDPVSLTYRVDTTGVNGMGPYTYGTLDFGGATVLQTDLDRLTFLFQPTGASFSDSVAVRGSGGTLVVQVDPWTGVAYASPR